MVELDSYGNNTNLSGRALSHYEPWDFGFVLLGGVVAEEKFWLKKM
jgi:hypothetical protein